MAFRRPLIVLVLISQLAACAWMPKLKLWTGGYDFQETELEVRELRRALLCGTPTEEPVLRLFDSAEQLKQWDANDSLQLSRLSLPTDRSFVLLEQGLRRTSGYSVELARTAAVDETGVLRLNAEWLEPAPDRLVTQMLTSLCVLVAVDAMPYERVEVLGPEGTVTVAVDAMRD